MKTFRLLPFLSSIQQLFFTHEFRLHFILENENMVFSIDLSRKKKVGDVRKFQCHPKLILALEIVVDAGAEYVPGSSRSTQLFI